MSILELTSQDRNGGSSADRYSLTSDCTVLLGVGGTGGTEFRHPLNGRTLDAADLARSGWPVAFLPAQQVVSILRAFAGRLAAFHGAAVAIDRKTLTADDQANLTWAYAFCRSLSVQGMAARRTAVTDNELAAVFDEFNLGGAERMIVCYLAFHNTPGPR